MQEITRFNQRPINFTLNLLHCFAHCPETHSKKFFNFSLLGNQSNHRRMYRKRSAFIGNQRRNDSDIELSICCNIKIFMIITKSTLEARRHRLHTLSNNNVTIAFLQLQNIAIDPWKFLWTNINQKVSEQKETRHLLKFVVVAEN